MFFIDYPVPVILHVNENEQVTGVLLHKQWTDV